MGATSGLACAALAIPSDPPRPKRVMWPKELLRRTSRSTSTVAPVTMNQVDDRVGRLRPDCSAPALHKDKLAPDPQLDVLLREPLVWSVQVCSRHREAHQKYLCIEDPLELADDRDAAPAARQNGSGSGYTGEGAKTVLPAEAMARVSFRLVSDQTPQHVRRPHRAQGSCGSAGSGILISAGFDVMAGDPLGGMLLEPEDLHALTREVMAGAAQKPRADDSRGVGIVATLEGGLRSCPDRPGGRRGLAGAGGDRPTPLAMEVVPSRAVTTLGERASNDT